MQSALRKPVFIKVKDLQQGRSGYNVIVKVVSVEKSQTQSKTPIVRAVVADETGAANAFFKGQTAALIQQGKVIAIRNGTIKFIKNRISLEIDMFGRITPEKYEVNANATNNISEKEIERKPRRKFNNNRQDDGDRRPRREGEGDRERRPRREGEGERRPRREENGERRPRREENGERRPRREENGERRPRREGEDRPRRDNDYDRRPRRQGQGDRRPRREDNNGDRRPRREDTRGDRRPPVTFSKIAGIEPGDDNLNFFAQVLKVEEVGRKARVILGDETGIVKAFLFNSDALKKGESVVLFNAEARVVKQHIEIQVATGGKVDVARRRVEEVNEKFDVSAKEWIEADQ